MIYIIKELVKNEVTDTLDAEVVGYTESKSTFNKLLDIHPNYIGENIKELKIPKNKGNKKEYVYRIVFDNDSHKPCLVELVKNSKHGLNECHEVYNKRGLVQVFIESSTAKEAVEQSTPYLQSFLFKNPDYFNKSLK
jgi:antibiotic biosynthesis monooxygenase (ABM) superfamily enzyme